MSNFFSCKNKLNIKNILDVNNNLKCNSFINSFIKYMNYSLSIYLSYEIVSILLNFS